MSNTNFKPGDRVLVVKEYFIQFEAFGGYILNNSQESGTYEMRSHVQPMPPFKRGDVVRYKHDHSAKPHKVLACFFDEVGDAVFVAESRKDRLFQCDNYELFTPQNDEQ